ncbi:MAG: calcium-binding protein, partial [Planctomycetota bacterium]|nr:calcium-binding protein [Planctomycetota bacterium]
RGDDGNDVIIGGAGDDTLAGANGNDVILGDWRFATDGTDPRVTDRLAQLDEPVRVAIDAQLRAREVDTVDAVRPTFNDNIYGGAGDDLLLGMQGSDTIYGDADIITSTAGGVSPDAEGGEDTTLDATSVIGFTATALVQPVPQPGPSFNDVIWGGSGDDKLYGEQGHDQVFGNDGNDSLSGGSGSDWMEGDAGNDRLDGGRDGDVIFGGAGDDSIEGGHGGDYLVGGSGNDKLSGGSGDDWLWGDATNNYPAGYTDPVKYSLDFMDTNRGEDFLDGGEGADVLLAGNGNDTATGGAGGDVILGGTGSDRIYGDGAGNGGAADLILGDTIFRLADVDVETRDKVRAVSAIADALLVRDGAVEPVDPVSADPPPEITYNDSIFAGAGDDVVFGQLGNDRLSGGEGADLLVGGVGNDELRGDAGMDVLDGGAGDDRLFGGDDTDVLVGGPGEDYFDGGAGRDYIFAQDGFVDLLCIDDLDYVSKDDIDLLACEGEL